MILAKQIVGSNNDAKFVINAQIGEYVDDELDDVMVEHDAVEVQLVDEKVEMHEMDVLELMLLD